MKQSWRMFPNLTSLRMVLNAVVTNGGAVRQRRRAGPGMRMTIRLPGGRTCIQAEPELPNHAAGVGAGEQTSVDAFQFKTPAQSSKYIQAVLNYCLEGNTANNFADVSQNTVRKVVPRSVAGHHSIGPRVHPRHDQGRGSRPGGGVCRANKRP